MKYAKNSQNALKSQRTTHSQQLLTSGAAFWPEAID